MIEFAGQRLYGAFVAFVNKHYPTKQTVQLAVLPGHDCVLFHDGEVAWAAYDPDEKVIWVADRLPEGEPDASELDLLMDVAHEYVHHIQNCEGREFCEDEAETRAEEMVKRWLEVAG